FGLFSDERKAERRLQELREKSLAVEVVPRYGSRHWLRIMPIADEVNMSDLESLQTSTIRLQQRPCEG
ncbi:MAG: hypothetical protein OIF35_12200, partial [Cellvibrionaceae bacterium]|nr:hypothetical protein [Cellvibrionaceae bacterium]